MKMYICGAVSNNPNYGIEFATAKEKLVKAGFEVACPLDLCTENDSWSVAMRKCIKALMDCDRVALIPSDHISKGRDLELRIAHELELEVRTVETWLSKKETKNE